MKHGSLHVLLMNNEYIHLYLEYTISPWHSAYIHVHVCNTCVQYKGPEKQTAGFPEGPRLHRWSCSLATGLVSLMTTYEPNHTFLSLYYQASNLFDNKTFHLTLRHVLHQLLLHWSLTSATTEDRAVRQSCANIWPIYIVLSTSGSVAVTACFAWDEGRCACV